MLFASPSLARGRAYSHPPWHRPRTTNFAAMKPRRIQARSDQTLCPQTSAAGANGALFAGIDFGTSGVRCTVVDGKSS